MTIPSKEDLQHLLDASVGGEVTLTPRQRGAMPDPKPGSPADIAAMQLLALGAPLAKEVLRLQEEHRQLLYGVHNLLAIIHRDGGHHTEKVGVHQSMLDAVDAVTNTRTELESLVHHRDMAKFLL